MTSGSGGSIGMGSSGIVMCMIYPRERTPTDVPLMAVHSSLTLEPRWRGCGASPSRAVFA